MTNTKTFLLAFLLLFITTYLKAQNIETQIKNVTVYRNGAIIERVGKFNLVKGNNTLYINNLSTELDPNTLRIAIGNSNVKILSVKHEIVVADNKTENDNNSAREKRLKLLSDSLSYLLAQNTVLTEQETLIRSNRTIGGQQNGVSVAELKAMTDFYKKELLDIETKKIAYNKRIENTKNEILRLKQEQYNSQKNLQKQDSRVKLVLSSENAVSNIDVTISYLIFSAKWESFYEIRVDGVGKPLNLVYGAHIMQQSTEDWNKVALTISTGDPSVGNDAPDFEKMYLPPVRKTTNSKKWGPPISNIVYGIVVDENGEPLLGCTIIEEGTENGVVTDYDGKFSIEMKNKNHKLSFSYIGYHTQTISPYNNMHVAMEEDEAMLEEVVVAGYGLQGRVAGINKSKKSEAKAEEVSVNYNNKPTKNIPLELSDSRSAMEFKIAVPYTIPSDGKVYDVSMLTYSIDTDYKYKTLPRESKDVFLIAELKDFSQYSLLKGSAYVYLDNVYQGECILAPNFASDTLTVSVGRDKDIAVNRQEVREFTSKKIIGSTIKVQKCFEINVKNNKSAAVNLSVIDQYPIAKYSDIKVELTDNGGAIVDSENGKLTWILNLAPQEKKSLRFTYEVKYPKSYNFTVE